MDNRKKQDQPKSDKPADHSKPVDHSKPANHSKPAAKLTAAALKESSKQPKKATAQTQGEPPKSFAGKKATDQPKASVREKSADHSKASVRGKSANQPNALVGRTPADQPKTNAFNKVFAMLDADTKSFVSEGLVERMAVIRDILKRKDISCEYEDLVKMKTKNSLQICPRSHCPQAVCATKCKLDGTKSESLSKCVCLREVTEIVDELYDLLKIHSNQIVHDCVRLSLWLRLLIPPYQGGNNMSNQVLEELCTSIAGPRNEHEMRKIRNYYADRGRLFVSMHKFPKVENHRTYYSFLNERAFYHIKDSFTLILMNYMALHDEIMKNMQYIDDVKKA